MVNWYIQIVENNTAILFLGVNLSIYAQTRELHSFCAELCPGRWPINFMVALKQATVTFASPKFSQLLLKHMSTMCENFKKIHQYFLSYAVHKQTNLHNLSGGLTGGKKDYPPFDYICQCQTVGSFDSERQRQVAYKFIKLFPR